MGASTTSPAATARVGDALPQLAVPLTPTVIVAGAIASRDFMPVHHDRAYAQGQGAPDIFFNILTSNGYVSRFITDWAGPDAFVRKIAIRLGAPAIPGTTLRFDGTVARRDVRGGDVELEIEMRGVTEIGEHVRGTVTLTVPAPSAEGPAR